MRSKVQKCPVCGTERGAVDGLVCRACGFPSAFVSYFSSAKAEACWQKEIRRNTKRPLPEIQAILAGRLAIGRDQISFLLPDALLLADGIYDEARREDNLVQISWGARHTVALRRDGTVSAQGNNEFGQCDVEGLREIRQVIAAARCTYALRQDGRVLVAGTPGSRLLELEKVPGAPLPALKGWTDVIRLALGEEHLVGLRENGSFLLGGFSPVKQSTFDARASKMRTVKAVAASTGGCTLTLLENGTVNFFGKENDARGEIQAWKDIVSIDAENGYAVGLSSEGSIRLAGNVKPLLDMGRSAAADWKDVAVIACGDSSIAGVTSSGQLLLAGNLPRRESLLTVWERDVRPEICQMING